MPLPDHTVKTPRDIQLVGSEVAIAWSDGSESFFPMDRLRAASPSAEQQGEVDILGHKAGGTDRTDYAGVVVLGWQKVGNYALRFDFSDGHNSGLYTFDYLAALASKFSP